MRELPPRTRRIPPSQSSSKAQSGTTSACAENTCRIGRWQHHWWNYLRARGEYPHGCYSVPRGAELPPRTRRIPRFSLLGQPRLGTTSAHAENTGKVNSSHRTVRNYLRARGEYLTATSLPSTNMELPPRTRRIPFFFLPTPQPIGTTSAHAENTTTTPTKCGGFRNYLRARGEYVSGHGRSATPKELPPRTRRIQSTKAAAVLRNGTTSAHAENTGHTVEAV